MREPAISFKNFGFKYKIQSEPTLFDINLDIYPGEKVLILGPSGSGKSTLASCVNGLIPFSNEGEITGSCRVNGVETRDSSVFKLSRSVGTVLQDTDSQFVGLSVGEDIAFLLENDCVPRHEMLPKVFDGAKLVGMHDFLQALPFDLSGGQKQKVALAGVINDDVNILIFDEPLASLDPQMGMTAIDLIDKITRDGERTSIIIEHRLEDVLHRHVDRIILMDKGRIIANTTPNELLLSDLLEKHGIREPLYITAMKYAGCDLSGNKQLSSVSEIELSDENMQRLHNFYKLPTEALKTEYGDIAVKVEDVSFSYTSEHMVVSNINIEVRKGERLAIIGKNGAGKSTTARLICGISRPKSGRIYIGGEDYKKLSIKEIGERIGYVMQNPNQMIVKDTIKDEVELALTLRKLPTDEIKKRSREALDACDIYSMRKWPVDAVSYGQKKRVTVASILALGPDVVILDEPTAGQDYSHYMEIIGFINRLNAEYGKTIIFITHDMHLAIENTDRAVVFADGEIIADDSVFSVLSNDDVIERANLKQTSLYILAEKLGISPEGFIRHFIEYERMVKSRE